MKPATIVQPESGRGGRSGRSDHAGAGSCPGHRGSRVESQAQIRVAAGTGLPLRNLVALAYLVLLLLLHDNAPAAQELRAQARQVLAQASAWKQVLTVGKLHESLSFAFQENRHVWLATLT